MTWRRTEQLNKVILSTALSDISMLLEHFAMTFTGLLLIDPDSLLTHHPHLLLLNIGAFAWPFLWIDLNFWILDSHFLALCISNLSGVQMESGPPTSLVNLDLCCIMVTELIWSVIDFTCVTFSITSGTMDVGPESAEGAS